jgi:hypothetical protein
MATPIKRIEKEFFLKVLCNEQIPVIYLKNQTEYTLTLEKATETDLHFRSNRIIPGLRVRRKMGLMFNYWGRVISFSSEIIAFRDAHIVLAAPEAIYKDLSRSFSRVPGPQDVTIQFLLSGERYSLAYPQIEEFERELDFEQAAENLDLKNLSGLISQIAEWISGYANGHRITIFKDVKPTSIEERLVAKTGKALYLPSTQKPFPKADPYPKKRLITEDIFRDYIEGSGTDPKFLDDTVSRFIRAKLDAGFLSDAWVPIQFHQYMIGYIHLWITDAAKQPLTYSIIDVVFQFASILAFSLKENGFFESGRIQNEPLTGKIIDISASGLLFVYPQSDITSFLTPDSEITLTIITPKRSISAKARIVRRFKGVSQVYFGCQFLNMLPEDTRFLFEFIYGRLLTDADAGFLAGQV